MNQKYQETVESITAEQIKIVEDILKNKEEELKKI